MGAMNPLELGSAYVLPSVMRRLVEVLVEEHNLSRVEVARRLGVSPAAITRYMKGERGAVLDSREFREGIEESVRALAGKIAAGALTGYAVQREAARIAVQAMARKLVCGFHAQLDPRLNPAACTACPEIFASDLQ